MINELEKPVVKIKHPSRCGRVKRLYRKPTQSITLMPNENTDTSSPMEEAYGLGADFRVVGFSGKIQATPKGSYMYEEVLKVNTEGKFPTFTATLRDGTFIDLGQLSISVAVDYPENLELHKTERLTRVRDIEEVGDLGEDVIELVNQKEAVERYMWLNNRLARLQKLFTMHNNDLKQLVSRYKGKRKRLYDTRHLNLISRVETVNSHIHDTRAWVKNTIMELHKSGDLPNDLKDKFLKLNK